MTHERAGRRRALLASLLCGAGVALAITLFGNFLGSRTLAETVAVAAVSFALTFLLLFLGGVRGLVVAWIVVPVLWLAALGEALAEGGRLTDAVALLPGRFAAWSFFALPLSLATVLYLHGARPQAVAGRAAAAVGILWLVAIIVSSYLASYALDVGGHPLQSVPALWAVGVLLGPAPFLVSYLLIHRLREAPSGT